MAELKNELTWSKTRAGIFEKCQRQYFFQYYGSWGGWDFKAPKRTRDIYVLKQLQTRQLWAGSVVHDRIQFIIESIQNRKTPMREDEAVRNTIAEMRAGFKNSKEAKYWKKPKSCGLFEHEYELEIPAEKWKENAEHVENCLRTFYQSDIFKKIQTLKPDQWLEVEKLSYFMLDDIKVWAVLDFSYREGDKIYIWDWKTGKSAEGSGEMQLACYALYASQKWDVDPASIETIEFNLPNNKLTEHHAGGLDFDAVKDRVRSSIAEMKTVLDDDVKNIATEENFPFIEDESACRWCNYKKVCPRFE